MSGQAGTEMVDASRTDDAAVVTIESAALGRLEVPQASVYTFPSGIIGFDAYRRFALVPSGRDGVLWLQSADEPALAFVLVDPFRAVPGYTADIPDAETASLGAGTPDELLVLAIVTLPGDAAHPATANLRAPLVLNVKTRRARQVVLLDDRFGVAEAVRV